MDFKKTINIIPEQKKLHMEVIENDVGTGIVSSYYDYRYPTFKKIRATTPQTDATCIFIDLDNGSDSTGTGTIANPVKTLYKAMSLLTTSKTNIVYLVVGTDYISNEVLEQNPLSTSYTVNIEPAISRDAVNLVMTNNRKTVPTITTDVGRLYGSAYSNQLDCAWFMMDSSVYDKKLVVYREDSTVSVYDNAVLDDCIKLKRSFKLYWSGSSTAFNDYPFILYSNGNNYKLLEVGSSAATPTITTRANINNPDFRNIKDFAMLRVSATSFRCALLGESDKGDPGVWTNRIIMQVTSSVPTITLSETSIQTLPGLSSFVPDFIEPAYVNLERGLVDGHYFYYVASQDGMAVILVRFMIDEFVVIQDKTLFTAERISCLNYHYDWEKNPDGFNEFDTDFTSCLVGTYASEDKKCYIYDYNPITRVSNRYDIDINSPSAYVVSLYKCNIEDHLQHIVVTLYDEGVTKYKVINCYNKKIYDWDFDVLPTVADTFYSNLELNSNPVVFFDKPDTQQTFCMITRRSSDTTVGFTDMFFNLYLESNYVFNNVDWTPPENKEYLYSLFYRENLQDDKMLSCYWNTFDKINSLCYFTSTGFPGLDSIIEFRNNVIANTYNLFKGLNYSSTTYVLDSLIRLLTSLVVYDNLIYNNSGCGIEFSEMFNDKIRCYIINNTIVYCKNPCSKALEYRNIIYKSYGTAIDETEGRRGDYEYFGQWNCLSYNNTDIEKNIRFLERMSDNIYKDPLFINPLPEYNFHLQSAVDYQYYFRSPAVYNWCKDWSNEFYSEEGLSGNTNTPSQDLTTLDYSKWEIGYISVVIENNGGANFDFTVTIEYSDDNSTWQADTLNPVGRIPAGSYDRINSTVISLRGGVVGFVTLNVMFPDNYYKEYNYFRVRVVTTSTDYNLTCTTQKRDLGCYSFQRDKEPIHVINEFPIEYVGELNMIRSLDNKAEKGTQGNYIDMCKPYPTVSLGIRFKFDNQSSYDVELFRRLMLIHMLDFNLKLYFEVMENNEISSATIQKTNPKLIDKIGEYLMSTGYGESEDCYYVRDASKEWKLNEWVGFYLCAYDTSSGDFVTEFPIVGNTDNDLVIAGSNVENHFLETYNYKIEYFLGRITEHSYEVLKIAFDKFQFNDPACGVPYVFNKEIVFHSVPKQFEECL